MAVRLPLSQCEWAVGYFSIRPLWASLKCTNSSPLATLAVGRIQSAIAPLEHQLKAQTSGNLPLTSIRNLAAQY